MITTATAGLATGGMGQPVGGDRSVSISSVEHSGVLERLEFRPVPGDGARAHLVRFLPRTHGLRAMAYVTGGLRRA